MLDDIIELLLELFLDGASAVVEDSRISKWIRIPVMILIAALFGGFIVFLMYLGVTGMEEQPLSVLYIVLGLALIGAVVWFCVKAFRKKK